jgi:hypothetical protein
MIIINTCSEDTCMTLSSCRWAVDRAMKWGSSVFCLLLGKADTKLTECFYANTV